MSQQTHLMQQIFLILVKRFTLDSTHAEPEICFLKGSSTKAIWDVDRKTRSNPLLSTEFRLVGGSLPLISLAAAGWPWQASCGQGCCPPITSRAASNCSCPLCCAMSSNAVCHAFSKEGMLLTLSRQGCPFLAMLFSSPPSHFCLQTPKKEFS